MPKWRRAPAGRRKRARCNDDEEEEHEGGNEREQAGECGIEQVEVKPEDGEATGKEMPRVDG